MASLEGTSKTKFSSKALKKLDDVLRSMGESLVDIAEAENLFKYEMDAATNRGSNGLSQLETVPERANHVKALLVPILVNRVKTHVNAIVDIQETLTTCDAFFREVCADRASDEVVMDLMQQLQLRLGVASTSHAPKTNVDVAEASNRVTGAQAVKQSRRIRRRRGNTCRHFCEHHQEVMNNALWRKLPKELLERICAFLPFSKTLELTKSNNPWTRLPTITTGFRRFCAEAHRDLFGLLMYHEESQLYRLVVSNSRHEEWFHMELTIPVDYGRQSFDMKVIFGHDGGLISILPCYSRDFKDIEETPSIFVYNPLTRDENKIPLSSSTSAKRINPILLQLIMNREAGCYKLNLVTQSDEPTDAEVFYSEAYDSKSGLWSTLDSGFLYGYGVLGEKAVYFDCTSKCFCDPDGTVSQDGSLVQTPHFDLHEQGSVRRGYRFFTFVRNNRFEMKFVDADDESRDYRFLKISERVWQDGWVKSSKSIYDEMEEPPHGFVTRLLACGRYLLVVSDDANTDAFSHRFQRMVLYDRETRKVAHDIPQFLTEDFDCDYEFMSRNLHFICDLKWDAVP